MATWSSGAFGNDGAAQWALALKVTDDFAAIEYVLDGSFEEGHFTHGACLRGIAAVAVLAEFLKYCQDPAGAAGAARLDAMNGQDVLDGDGLGATFARIYDVAEHINAWVQARLGAADLPTTKLLSRAAYFIEAVLADPDERSRAMDDAFVDEWLEALHELHALVVSALQGSPVLPGSIEQVAMLSGVERAGAPRGPRPNEGQTRGSR